MPDAILTFDLGTTRLKAAAFDLDGTLLRQEAARNVEHRDGPRAWQDADEWWKRAVELARAVLAHGRVAGRAIVALSLSGRAGAGIFADGAGRVLVHPWSDDRHREELAELIAATGGAPLPYAAMLLAKYLWLTRHERELASRIARAFYAKDFLLYRLAGAHFTDYASGPDGPQWDPAMLRYAGAPAGLVPSPAMPWALGGTLTAEAAHALGLTPGIPVAVGAHDGVCANVGAGASRPHHYAVTLGTNAVVRAILDHAPPGAHRFYGLPPDRHVIGGNAMFAGRSPDWFLDFAAADDAEGRVATLRKLDAAAGEVDVGAAGARFFPFLAGRLAPVRRPRATALFAGLRAHHGRAELYRAVLEGAAFALREVYQQVRGWSGEPTRIRLTGAGAASETWSAILADVLRAPLEVTDAAVEGRGAAIFAAVAIGRYASYDEAADRMVQVSRRIAPDGQRADRYDAVYRHWAELERITRAFDDLASPS